MNIQQFGNDMRRSCLFRISSIFFFLFMLVLNGCDTPTYPKQEIEQRVINMVKKEYGYDIRARIVGKTLGLYFPITQIFSHDMSFTDAFQERLQDIFLSAARVTLSTDADVQFFVTKYTDDFKGIEISMARSVDDTKRLLLNNISRYDYAERTVIDYKYDPEKNAAKKIRTLFKDIPEQKSSLVSSFLTNDSFQKSFFFNYLMESELKSSLSYSILKLETKRISDENVLVYCKVRETYKPKPGYQHYRFMFESPATLEFMFEVMVIKGVLSLITQVYSYQDIVDSRKITPPMPEPLAEHGDISSWETYFYLEDMTLPNFIIKQISSRLNRKLSEASNPDAEPQEGDTERLSGPQNITMVEAEYKIKPDETGSDEKLFRMIFRFSQNTDGELSAEMANLTLTYFKRTIKKYSFTDYNALVFLDGDGKLIKRYEKNEISSMKADEFSWKSFLGLKPEHY